MLKISMVPSEKNTSSQVIQPDPISGLTACTNLPGDIIDLTAVYKMQQISLGQISMVGLMKRNDTKFILPVSSVRNILEKISDKYYVLEINSRREATYETVYYDATSLQSFRDHVNGKLNRFKIRTREYVDSNLQYLEVKGKTNKGVTQKNRIAINSLDDVYNENALTLVNKHSGKNMLQLLPVLINNFKRITLINYELTERVTLDFDIRYRQYAGEPFITVPHLAIIEIKQEKFSFSFMRQALAEIRIKNAGISKYCLGVSLLMPDEKLNRYKRKLRRIQKITNYELFI